MLATDEIKQAEPRLAGLNRLRTRWMNGVMFYLDRDVPVVHGHSLYVDSLWALTSISQRQFWPGVDFEQLGDGRVEGILSVDVSDWEAQGNNGKQAMYCSSEEVCEEVWAQLKRSLNDAGVDVLEDANVLHAFLDPDIVYPNPTAAENLEPLLVNTAGSWNNRPEATTAIENLVLASDYVRTHTDLATMEGANEAARRAVNGILERAGSTQPRCQVWPLSEPEIFAPARALDRVLFALHRPPELAVSADGGRPDREIGAGLVGRLRREADLAPAVDGRLREVQTLRDGYAALNRGEWERSGRVPASGDQLELRRGSGPGRAADPHGAAAEIVEFWSTFFAAWEEWEMAPEDFVEAPNGKILVSVALPRPRRRERLPDGARLLAGDRHAGRQGASGRQLSEPHPRRRACGLQV